jgi:hypothetical protein
MARAGQQVEDSRQRRLIMTTSLLELPEDQAFRGFADDIFLYKKSIFAEI